MKKLIWKGLWGLARGAEVFFGGFATVCCIAAVGYGIVDHVGMALSLVLIGGISMLLGLLAQSLKWECCE